MSKNFENDLVEVYEIITKRQKELGEYFKIVENDENTFGEMRVFIDNFLENIGLSKIKENRLSALTRLIALRDEQLVQSLMKEKFSDQEIDDTKEISYLWVKDFYLQRHEDLLLLIEDKRLLNEFYRILLRGVHDVGISLSHWQSSWTEHIINTINPGLKEEFGEGVLKYLNENNLFDKNSSGQSADRSYSVLKKVENGYKALSYAEFFKDEVISVVENLRNLTEKLSQLRDDDTHHKDEYIAYFEALADAFGETNRDELIEKWSDVDRRWMRITSPIQVGHPMEYYEDHYRKAVALEWDVRISNPKNEGAEKTYQNILHMYKTLFSKLGSGKENVLDLTLSNLQRVGLYIGRPALYYAAEFNGLFSAQVVPNDEIVSKEEGKKIFAFSDNILDSLRAKPFLKIQNKIFGKEFMEKERELVFKKAPLWYRVYEATTVGHEYGHILWLDNDTESKMNASGVFKNIEEFKATCGGLMAFFMREDDAIKEYVLADILKRAVGLIAWMRTGEVEPYYCEGLIHLSALFDSGVFRFDEELKIDMSDEAYERLKQWYFDVYESLAKHYLDKKDANEFLSKYAVKVAGIYLPVDKNVKSFVDYYWSLHQNIGRDIDEETKREDWL
jgi:hypothetical protein